mgnify:CR=1 FL=1
MPKTLTEADLNGFTGCMDWTRHSPQLFRNVISSEGMIFVAEQAGAYWLLDAIASHETADPKLLAACKADEGFDYLHFWKLNVQGNEGTLTCVKDSGLPPVVVQKIEHTDFPIQGVFTVYAGNDGPGTLRKLFLPSEY